MKNKLVSTVLLFGIIATLCGQNLQADKSELFDPSLNPAENEYLDKQADALLHEVNQVLRDNQPAYPEAPARRTALLLLDAVLHEVYAPHRVPVQEFFRTRISKAIEEIECSEIIDGMRVWKLYNHGFVVQTKSTIIGFDLVRGKSVKVEQFCIEDAEMSQLIDLCDVLFISHYHADHAEQWVAQTFINQGKPVVAPPDIWEGKAIHKQITHMEREAHREQLLPIKDGQLNLKVVVYPGHQGQDIINNNYLVITPEDLSVAQMGDQSNDDDFKWIDEAGKHQNLDVLLPNCWTTDIVRVSKGFNPGLIITGHENELGHTIDHREPYWLTYQRQMGSDRFGGSSEKGYSTPLVLMTWGESYLYKRTNF